MNQHTAITKSPRKRAKPAAKPSPAPKLGKVADTVKRAGALAARSSAKVTAKATKPIVQSIKQEQPSTLAKMAVAALTPRLVGAGLRFLMRNPMVAISGVAAFAAFAYLSEDGKAQA